MIRLRLLFLLLPVALLQVGCAGSSTAGTQQNVDANGQSVSAVPWNRPETWETSGQLGGMSQ